MAFLTVSNLNGSCMFNEEENLSTSTSLLQWVNDYTSKVVVSGEDISLTCESLHFRDANCSISTPVGHTLASISAVVVHSDSSCVGRYGLNSGNSSMWIKEGCRADFKVSTTKYGCPTEYTASGERCRKEKNYSFINYSCNANDKNSQGFGWELVTPATNDGVKIDHNLNNIDDFSSTVYSHATQPQCKRKYQTCTIECEAPLVFDATTGKCVINYKDDCELFHPEHFYSYDSSTGTYVCMQKNQCEYDVAYKNATTGKCEMESACYDVNGVCSENPLPTCASGFTYSAEHQACLATTKCLSTQYVMEDDNCGGLSYCNPYDVETLTECIHTETAVKSCLTDTRSGNLCYVGGGATTPRAIDYKRPLIKSEFSGDFKAVDFNRTLDILCTNTSADCEFRLTRIYTISDDNLLCFEDAQGVNGCVAVSPECSLYGDIEYSNGIKQLQIENGNSIVAYNMQDSSTRLGTISSTCLLSGKVGSFEGIHIGRDITSVHANGADLEFWDMYQRGFIGVISMLPTIPEEDYNDGYSYEDADLYTLLNKGFTAFYSGDSTSVYGVYNGFLTRDTCESLIQGTSFYIAQAQDAAEQEILNGLNFKSGDNYNYNDGDYNHGSCVVKSEQASSFANQENSIIETTISDARSVFVCSPFVCQDFSCQYNQCQTNYSPTLYEQDFFNSIYSQDFPNATAGEACINDICDSNQPYFRYCGNAHGCENDPNIYQQSNGTCISVECAVGEELDVTTGKCMSYGCKNSIERNGKCYKSLF